MKLSFVIASAHPLRAKLDKAKIRNLDFFIDESLQEIKERKE